MPARNQKQTFEEKDKSRRDGMERGVGLGELSPTPVGSVIDRTAFRC